ncbi:hypothetical protein B5P19_14680 [Clavibacter sepedonicus]|nr:hypothetical protein B5P19_14680 [Clavibacter sepedonicus]OQJ54957.1 hypothetical protein B5P20_13260 [Clavibacter sepedonicus]
MVPGLYQISQHRKRNRGRFTVFTITAYADDISLDLFGRLLGFEFFRRLFRFDSRIAHARFCRQRCIGDIPDVTHFLHDVIRGGRMRSGGSGVPINFLEKTSIGGPLAPIFGDLPPPFDTLTAVDRERYCHA